MIIKSLTAAPDEVIAAFEHIKAIHPAVNYVSYDADRRWHFGCVDGYDFPLTGAEDVGLLNAAADAQYANPEILPVIYLAETDNTTTNLFVVHIATWHANVVKRVQSVLQIPEEEAIEVTDNDLGTTRLIKDTAEKNLFLSGVMCALTEFVTLPIEQVDKVVDDSAEQSEQEA